jgi:hypothetical protein
MLIVGMHRRLDPLCVFIYAHAFSLGPSIGLAPARAVDHELDF